MCDTLLPLTLNSEQLSLRHTHIYISKMCNNNFERENITLQRRRSGRTLQSFLTTSQFTVIAMLKCEGRVT